MALQEEVVEFFTDTADTLGFLSQAMFKELTDEAIEALAAGEYPGNTDDEVLNEGHRLMRRYFKFSSGDRRTDLACEYARVFLAAGVYSRERETAVPYESVFTSDERIIMQDARDEVVRWFAADGFSVNPDLHEPEDHLSFELEYLATMARRAAEAARAGKGEALLANIGRERAFIADHVLNWLPRLAAVAREYAQRSFYPGVLLIAQGTLAVADDVMDRIESMAAEGALDGWKPMADDDAAADVAAGAAAEEGADTAAEGCESHA